jgi:23S rRNA (uracil1939-C5)-methyltransferase
LFAGLKQSRILGVDNSKMAIESAQENAVIMGLSDADYICASVEKFLPNVEFGLKDLIFINPPRAGCPVSVIELISQQEPEDFCLISCALDTLVRDLEQWQQRGYRARSMAAFDMFPFTDFLETVSIFEKTS